MQSILDSITFPNGEIEILSLQRGGLKGQFEFQFRQKTAGSYSVAAQITLKESILDPVSQTTSVQTNTYTLAPFSFTVVPGEMAKILLNNNNVFDRNNDLLQAQTTDDENVILIQPQDQNGNVIYDAELEDLNLDLAHTSSRAKVLMTGGLYSEPGWIAIKVTTRMVGNLTMTQGDNMLYISTEATSPSGMLTWEVKTGDISVKQSVASITNAEQTVTAGGYLEYYLQLYDSYKNPIDM